MWYLILVIILAVIIGTLLLRLRVSTTVDKDDRRLFVGLGRSGVEFNFVSNQKQILFAGRVISREALHRKKQQIIEPQKEDVHTGLPGKKIPKKRRMRSLWDLVELIPQISTASRQYAFSLLKSVRIEELNGTVRAGFDSPDTTGYLYGFYASMCGTLPGFQNRLRFTPVWDSAYFDSSVRASVALPLYRFFWRTLVLMKDLPLRKIIKVAIGNKERSHDGQ